MTHHRGFRARFRDQIKSFRDLGFSTYHSPPLRLQHWGYTVSQSLSPWVLKLTGPTFFLSNLKKLKSHLRYALLHYVPENLLHFALKSYNILGL